MGSSPYQLVSTIDSFLWFHLSKLKAIFSDLLRMHGTSNTLATVDSNAPGDSELNAGFEGVVGLRPRLSQSDIGRNFPGMLFFGSTVGFCKSGRRCWGELQLFFGWKMEIGDVWWHHGVGGNSPKDMEVMSFRTFWKRLKIQVTHTLDAVDV